MIIEKRRTPTTQRWVTGSGLVDIVKDIAERFQCSSLRPLQRKQGGL